MHSFIPYELVRGVQTWNGIVIPEPPIQDISNEIFPGHIIQLPKCEREIQ